MLEPPNLSEDAIIATVQARYDIAVAALTFLPIGNDSATWVFRLPTVNGDTLFLKLRKGAANEPSFVVPRFLADHAVTQVAAALLATSGALWVNIDGFALALYPYIDGATGADAGMTERHWIAYGAALRQIHNTELPPAIAQLLQRETYVPDRGDVIAHLDARLATTTFTDPSERELAAFWQERREAIRTLAERAAILGRRLEATNPPPVLCHADIHTWNILIDAEDQLWIVDWDETMLAPKERDLMFVVGGLSTELVRPREEAWFFAGYGVTTVDPLALAYYRFARAVSDLGAYAEDVFLAPDASTATKHAAVQGFLSCFAPGAIIDLAREADRKLA